MSGPLAILIDTTRCTGCDDCVKACKEENRLGEDVARRWKRRIDDLSSTRYTTVLQRQGNHFVRQFCRHCLEPACVSACLVGALTKTPEGPVVYDSNRCMGCRYCMTACPYGIPRYDWEKSVPFVRKCTMCQPRIQEGKKPACVEACRYDAAVFGPRADLLAEAHRRIEAEPQKYVGRVFGESEVGGTSVLYVSDIPLDFLAYRADLGDKPLPELTWAALSKVPPLVVGMTGLMAGVWWITSRRMKLAAQAEAAAAPAQGAAAPPASEHGERQQ
ncbi:MAG: 4Fe-4S dicluster domain-containing protein [Planctomycetes bacterium]|nr:4Fe-4S dicluster domain-containing protein [Planctomycetota bacterium]